MKRTLVWLLLPLLGLPLFGQSTSTSAPEDAAVVIAHLREGLSASFSQRNAEGLLPYLDPQVVVTWQNAELCQGTEAVRAFYNKMLTGDQHPVREIRMEPEVLGRQVNGDWAVAWGKLHDHFVLNDGSDLSLESVFTATFAKRGDRWLVTTLHGSVNAFENPVSAAAIRRAIRPLGFGSFIAGLVIGLFAMRVFRKQNVAAGVAEAGPLREQK